MTTHDPRFTELLPAYAAGALDDAELEVLERHLEDGCEECEAELRSWAQVSDELAGSVSPEVISDDVRRNFMEALAAEPERAVAADRTEEPEPSLAHPTGRPSGDTLAADAGPEPHRSPANDNRGLLGLAAALLVAAIGWGFWSQSTLRTERAEAKLEKQGLELALSRAEELLSESEQELALAQAAQDIVAAAGVESVSLASTAAGNAMTARSYADPETGRAVIYASRLPDLDADRTYQLWYIQAGAPVSAGVFEAEGGTATIVVQDLAAIADVQGWAISVEPQGGSEQPTGPIVLSS